MKKIILTVSLATFVAAAFAADSFTSKDQAGCTNKAKASCPVKEKAGCCEKKSKAECPFKKAEADSKSAECQKK